VVNKYLIILIFILCFNLVGCIREQPMATPTVKHSTTSQIKNYVCVGEYDVKHFLHNPFTVDYEGNFYITHSTNDNDMNIDKYNSQGKYITKWVPEIKKRKLNCWFVKRKYGPGEQYLSDIFADRENFYLAYGGAYKFFPDGSFFIDYSGHIEKFDLNGNFITAIKPKKHSFLNDFVRYITKDKNGNFYLASKTHIEKYNANWKLQSILYPFKGKYSIGYCLIDDLAVDSQGYIYTFSRWGDYGDGYFVKFDSSGEVIKKWIFEGKNKLYFYAIEIDPDDNLFVLSLVGGDTYRIQKFDSSGKFITEWFSKSTRDFLATYYDMKIDSTGNVYVYSLKGNIRKFSPKK